MENNSNKTEEKNEDTLTSTQEGTQGHPESTGRINIDDINKRNAEERKKEKKSSYILAGIVSLLIIIAVIYFFG